MNEEMLLEQIRDEQITPRQLFAAAALAALYSWDLEANRGQPQGNDWKALAKQVWRIADAVLREENS